MSGLVCGCAHGVEGFLQSNGEIASDESRVYIALEVECNY